MSSNLNETVDEMNIQENVERILVSSNGEEFTFGKYFRWK